MVLAVSMIRRCVHALRTKHGGVSASSVGEFELGRPRGQEYLEVTQPLDILEAFLAFTGDV